MKLLLLALADHVLTFALLKASLLVLATWGLAMGLRRAAPAVRATVWWTGACALLVVPLSAAVAWPLVELSLLEFPQALFRRSAADLVSARAGAAGAAPGLAGLSHLPLAAWFAALWIAGAVAFGGSFVARVAALHRLARRGLSARDARTLRLLADRRDDLGIRRPVRIVYSAELATPLTFGWIRPVVLLPARARHWDVDRFGSVITHELAHIRRHDWPALVALELVRAIHWANPLVWSLIRRARREQELASDRLVLELGVPARDYAGHVLALARDADPRRTAAAALPFARRATLRARIDALMRGSRAPGLIAGPLVPVTLALGMAFVVGSAELWSCEQPTRPARAEDARNVERPAPPPGVATSDAAAETPIV